jgi:hypothetical protein
LDNLQKLSLAMRSTWYLAKTAKPRAQPSGKTGYSTVPSSRISSGASQGSNLA